jgi:hypothetical protein
VGALHRQHDAELAHPAAVAVVRQGDGPRDRRPLIVIGGVVVNGIVDGSSHR